LSNQKKKSRFEDPESESQPPMEYPVVEKTGQPTMVANSPLDPIKSHILVGEQRYLKLKQIGPVGPVEIDGRKTMLRLWICIKDGSPLPAETYCVAEPVK